MILDTCAVLWLASGHKALSRAALKRINEAPAVYISAISAFELAIKVAKGKLKLPLPSQEWLEKAVEQHALTVLPLDIATCIRAAELPLIHDDPCDRLIIASAKIHALEVVTKDTRFAEYGMQVVS